MPYDFAVVDEAQDLTVAQLRFFAALGSERPNALFFAGDIGQRIFQQALLLAVPSAWTFAVGRARYASTTAPRTRSASKQTNCWPRTDRCRWQCRGTQRYVSIFNGPPPAVHAYQSEADESVAVAARIKDPAQGWCSSPRDRVVCPFSCSTGPCESCGYRQWAALSAPR